MQKSENDQDIRKGYLHATTTSLNTRRYKIAVVSCLWKWTADFRACPLCCGRWKNDPNEYHDVSFSCTGACPLGRDATTGLCLEAKQSCPVGSNPIQPGTGDKLHEQTDIHTTSAAHSLSFQRYYRSQNPHWNAGITPGWNHNWQQRLSLSALNAIPATLVALHANGTHSRYSRSATVANTWVSTDQSKDVLSELRDTAGVLTGYQLLRFETDAVETYNTQGVLLSVRERNGWTATLQYSDASTPSSIAPRSGLLLAVRNHFGRELRLTYDSAARLASVTGFDGQTVRYSYHSSARLTRVTWPDASFRSYHYEDNRFPYALTGITDELGVRLTTYAYDSEGRAVLTEQAAGANRVQVSYNADGSRTVTDNAGANGTSTSRTYRFETVGGVIRPTSVSAPCPLCGSTAQNTRYDASGNIIRQVAHTGEVIYTRYDSRGRPIEVATFGASAQSSTSRPALSTALKVVSTRWHSTWNVPTQMAEPGKLTSFSYNAQGSLSGRSERQTTDTTGASAFAAVQVVNTPTLSTDWAYNPQQLPTTVVEREQAYGTTTVVEKNRLSITYDSLGNATSLRNVRTNQTAHGTYDQTGRLISETDPFGTISRTYTLRGWIAQERSTDGVNTVTTTVTHDARGLVTEANTQPGLRFQWTYHPNHSVKAVYLNGQLLTAGLTYEQVREMLAQQEPRFLWSQLHRLSPIAPAYAQTAPAMPLGGVGGTIGKRLPYVGRLLWA